MNWTVNQHETGQKHQPINLRQVNPQPFTFVANMDEISQHVIFLIFLLQWFWLISNCENYDLIIDSIK